MTENKFPKKEFIILSIGEALCALVTILGFWGVSILKIFEFEFTYQVITGALLGAVVILFNFIFLSMSVNKAVDEYMALRGEREMTDEEAEAFAEKHSMLIQNAVKKSFIVRVISIAATLVVAFILDWFHPLATIVPIIAYHPILTWGNHIYESAKRIISRFKSGDNGEEARNEDGVHLAEEPMEEPEAQETIEEPLESTTEESTQEEKSEDNPSSAESEDGEAPTEEDASEENEGDVAPEEDKENTEGSDLDEL